MTTSVETIVAKFANLRNWSNSETEENELSSRIKAKKAELELLEQELGLLSNRHERAMNAAIGVQAALSAAGIECTEAILLASLESKFPKPEKRELTEREYSIICGALPEYNPETPDDSGVTLAKLSEMSGFDIETCKIAVEKGRKEGKAYSNGKRGRGCCYHR